jgi:hypothetical protein
MNSGGAIVGIFLQSSTINYHRIGYQRVVNIGGPCKIRDSCGLGFTVLSLIVLKAS